MVFLSVDNQHCSVLKAATGRYLKHHVTKMTTEFSFDALFLAQYFATYDSYSRSIRQSEHFYSCSCFPNCDSHCTNYRESLQKFAQTIEMLFFVANFIILAINFPLLIYIHIYVIFLVIFVIIISLSLSFLYEPHRAIGTILSELLDAYFIHNMNPPVFQFVF